MSEMIPEEVSGVHQAPANAAAHRRYALLSWGLALLLLLLAPWQVQWQDGKDWAHQPALFSMVGVAGMLVFGVLELWHLWRRTAHAQGVNPAPELVVWLQALEFALWFMVHVWAVPHLGYLLTTLVFALGMTYRLGYRRRVFFVAAIGVGVSTVLVFKGALSVKVPAADWYQALPEPLATFFTLNL